MVTPASLTPASLLLSATSSLKIDDRVTLKETNGNAATIANLSSATLQVGTDGHLGDIWSLGPLTIGARTAVNGTIHGAVSITTSTGVTIKAKDNKAFQTVTTSSSVTFPTQNAGGLDLEPGETAALGPGSYGAIAVKSRSVLHISSGSYTLESLDLEPSSSLALNTIAGPVVFYVRTSVILRGNITTSTDARDFTLIYLGTSALAVEAPLNATVIAPSAQVNITSVQPITGACFAAGIEVYSGDTVTHVATRGPVVAAREGQIEAESFDANSGGHNTGTQVNQLSGGDWLFYRGVDFGQPGQYNRMRFDLLSPTGVDEIVVHVDSLTGPTVADLLTLQTGTGYIIESTPLISAVSGIHDTYIVFNGSESDGLDWFMLSKGPQAKVTVDAGQMPPDGSAPPYDALPHEEVDDIPDNIAWAPIPQHVTIAPGASEGASATMNSPFQMLVAINWTGTSTIVLSVLDQNNNPIVPETQSSFPDNKMSLLTPALPAGKINLIVKNTGPVPVVVNASAGFFPPITP